MIRVKIIKPHKQYKVGETVYVTPNIAHDLIDRGYGERTKDIVGFEYNTKRVVSKGQNAKKSRSHRTTIEQG